MGKIEASPTKAKIKDPIRCKIVLKKEEQWKAIKPRMPESTNTETEGSPSSPPPDKYIGQVINEKYRIISAIGVGGMGAIYRAEQMALGREVAIKLMRIPEDQAAKQRFLREAYEKTEWNPNLKEITYFSRDCSSNIDANLLRFIP